MLIALQVISALVTAGILFLQAAGLTLIFGVCRVLNLAHGTFFMLALFLTWSVSSMAGEGAGGFWASLLVVPLICAAVGVITEVVLFRRIYRAHLLAQVLLTIGIIYIIGDVIRFGWGLTAKSVPVPDQFGAPLEVMGVFIPSYYAFVIAVAAFAALAIWYIVHKTSWGLLIRAASQDRDMSAALGVRQQLLFASVFGLSLWLVGLAGALYAPIGGANLGMDLDNVIEAFAVVVIGGMGSIAGSLVAALMIGAVKSFGILVLPQFSMAFVFGLMALVLLFRPNGLFGAPE